MTVKVPKGTELIPYTVMASSLRFTLADGTVVANLPLVSAAPPMVSLLYCARKRRVANPFVKPAPMMNQYEKGGEYK